MADDDPTPDDVPRSVRARLDGAVARLGAHFVIAVGSGVSESARTIAIPAGASVTAASATVNGHTHRLSLLDAKVAGDRWKAVRNRAAARQRAWSLTLRTDRIGMITLDTAIPRDTKVTLDLELEAPTCFVQDLRHVSVPESWFEALEPALRAAKVADEDSLGIACGKNEGSWFAIATTPNRAPTTEGRITTSADRLALSAHDIARVEIDLARELAQIPDDMRTAIVVDASRSLTTDELDEQRAIVAAYLAVAPRGSVQLISYARKATPLLERWISAREAAPSIDRALRSLTLRNGSNLDAGLSAAASWLAKTTGTKRVLVFSDELLAKRVSDQIPTLAQHLPAATIVHTILLGRNNGVLARDDAALLAPLAAATTGIAVDGGVDGDGHVDATILARPVALDHVTLTTPHWTTSDHVTSTCEPDTSLAEGMSCTWWGEGGESSGDITVNGLIWNKPFGRVIRPDRTHALTLARALSALGAFPAVIQRDIDEAALVVNSVWSLYATWGGSGGYGDEASGSAGWGTICGCDGIGTIGHGMGTGSGRVENSDLRDQLADAVRACHPDGARVAVDIETTYQEIADVEVSVIPQSATVKDCVTEAVWNVQLHLRGAQAYAKSALAYVY